MNLSDPSGDHAGSHQSFDIEKVVAGLLKLSRLIQAKATNQAEEAPSAAIRSPDSVRTR